MLPTFSKRLCWRIALCVLLAVSLGLAAALWFSGAQETYTAFQEGRRFLIKLDTGEIQGKQAPKNPAQNDAENPANPTADHPDASPAESTAAAEAPPSDIPALPPAIATTSDTLAHTEPVPVATVPLAPINPEFSEKTATGLLPILANGKASWRYYAKPYERTGSLPMIAIIISGLGQNKTVTDSAVRLPETIALSFSPYAKEVANWVNVARSAGHEALLDLPLQPSNYPASDPGPQGLLADHSPQENEAHLNWLMERAQGYTGFLTPQNESFSANDDAFKALLASLDKRGLMLVIGHAPVKNETKQVIEGTTTPNAVADVLLDEELSATAIQARLSALEQIAKDRGYAIGIGQAYPLTLAQLNAWAAKLGNEGFVLVPVTFIARLKFS